MKGLKLKAIVASAIGFTMTVFIIFLMDISYDNREQRLRTDVLDQERKIEANYDKMWKVISQQAQILDKYANDFLEIYKGMMTGRYGDGGSKAMFQWIKEHNPQIDASLYKKIMTTVEATRTSFEREQRRYSEMGAAHMKLYVTKPAKWFVDGEPVEIQIVSSKKTKKVMETGEENEVDLFTPKKK